MGVRFPPGVLTKGVAVAEHNIEYEGWRTPSWEQQCRLDCIRDGIFENDFKGKTVLDLACGLGYYSYMALQNGARHVHLCEKDEGSIEYARSQMTERGLQDKCSFVFGNMFDLLDLLREKIDVVLCNGILYHTPRQHELLEKIKLLSPELVLMETLLLDTPYIGVSYWPDYDLHVPSQRFVEILLAEVGHMSSQWRTSAPHRALYVLK